MKEIEKQLRKARKAVENVEAELEQIENQIAQMDQQMAQASEYNEADYKAYSDLKREQESKMHEWEKLSYEVELLEDKTN